MFFSSVTGLPHFIKDFKHSERNKSELEKKPTSHYALVVLSFEAVRGRLSAKHHLHYHQPEVRLLNP